MVQDPSNKRRCTMCGEEKPETSEHFHQSTSGRLGLAARCKKCHNIVCRPYARLHYARKTGR